MHLFADISSHGFGHLAITGPVLDALAEIVPDLRLTVRCGLPAAKLRQRIGPPFAHIEAASDFGFMMHDALSVDLAATAAAYRAAHADWPRRVAGEAHLLAELRPDVVLSNVSYLPLAGAAATGIPALAICSLNWAELFAHFFGHADWAAPIHAEMLAAYRAADRFIRITPAMAMADLANTASVGPVASRGRRRDLGLAGDKAVLVALGGIDHHLPVDRWPHLPGIRWLVARHWQCRHPDAIAYEDFGLSFTDLLCSVDAIVTKPGYGTFTEAACNGTPVLYQRRADWPEQECLIAWLQAHGRCREIAGADLEVGDLAAPLAALWRQAPPPAPVADGARAAAELIDATRRRTRPAASAA
ncbi:hypothetical protein [Dechloromonas sp. H13]|uniref:hypothetical protein n=1 Tax=Dechloromonas sp. H13 TaxID=2570193 RepID=UPI0018851069|nr:hypothetical protein [Dechloromonas sp. H13]